MNVKYRAEGVVAPSALYFGKDSCKSMNQNPCCITNNLSCTGSAPPIEVMLDPHVFTTKPLKASESKAAAQVWRDINHRLGQHHATISIPELATRICAGQAFAPGVFRDGRRSGETWVQQQVFALDCEDGYGPEDFLTLCRQWDTSPAFLYPSFNHTDERPRFRAVFVCDQIITDKRLRRLIQGLLMEIFDGKHIGHPQTIDQNCSDAARFFLGTNKPLIHQSFEARINPFDLLDKYLKRMKAKDPAHYAEYEKRLALDFGIDYRNRQLGVSCVEYNISHSVENHGETDVGVYCYKVPTSNSPDTSIIFVGDMVYQIHWNDTSVPNPVNYSTRNFQSLNTPTCIRAEDEDLRKPLIRLIESDKRILLQRCQLLREFITGENHIGHHGRRILVTNLRQRDGGIAWFRKGLASREDYTEDSLIDDAKRYCMKPEGCDHCSYSQTCDHKTNLLQQIPPRRRECRQVRKGPHRETIAVTRQKLRDALSPCFHSPYPKIYVIKCDSGVGKTRELLLQDMTGVCVAFDTHRLKAEAYGRLQDRASNVFLWPEPPELPEELDLKLKRCYAVGTGGATQIYREALNHPKVQDNFQWAMQIGRYIEALREVHIHSQVFTTHEKAYQLQRNPNLHTFVFDEDFVKTLVRIDEVRLCDIDTIRKIIRDGGDERYASIDEHFKSIQHAPSRITHVQTPVEYPANLIHALIQRTPRDFASPIESLFTSGAYRKDAAIADAPKSVFCITRQTLNEDKKFIVLSATADEEVYRMLFGDRLEFIDISGTEIMGKLFNHPKRSYSKQSIYTDLDAFVKTVGEDKARYGFDGIITHKFCAETENGGMCLKGSNREIPIFGTFGGLQGLDSFGGKDIAVYGTPYPPEYVVKLWMPILGIEVNEDEYDFQERAVNWGEFEMNMPTCSERQDVQKLYAWLTYSEIAQAVGRARLVNHDCQVHVFAKIPMSGGTLAN